EHDAVDGGHAQGTVDRAVRRGPAGLVVDRSALPDGGGLLGDAGRAGRRPADPGRRLVELAGTPGLALRRPRRELAGDAQRRRPLPRGLRRHAGARVAARARCGGRRRLGRHRAGCRLPLHRPRRALRARARAVGPPAPPGVERGVRRAGVPHDPAAPHRRRLRARRDLHRRRLPHRRRRHELGALQHRHQVRVHARRPQLPRVRAVRAQGGPPPLRARPAVPAEPRRRLPLRRRRRLVDRHRVRAAHRVRLRDGGAPAPAGDGVHVPDRRRGCPLAGRREGAGLPHPGLRVELGADGGGLAARRLLRRGDARRDVRRHPRAGGPLLRRPQRRRLGLPRRGRHVAAGARGPAGRDGGAGGGAGL
ncbi:MAG: GH74, partial [uncultured Nocardioides sp.]